VCMHCQDPECLTGCPTGAIARFPNGEIDINAKTCIGCGDCATQCPYNAISMIGRNPENGKGAWQIAGNALSALSIGETKLPPPVTQTEDLLAIKCNLCHETPMNPKRAKRQAYSCEENCPTGALVRVDPKAYFDEVNQAIGLIRRTNTHAVVKNIHKFDLKATMWHVLGTLIFVASAVLAVWATAKYSQDVALTPGSWLTMRWITGLSGLGAITWVMMYPVRKQIYRRRAGALRYWMLSHIYLGLAATALLLVHGGTRSGGLLTTVLMISFDLVIATGIFGALCYWLVPKFMTKIEGEPLLIEDLEERRAELRAELQNAAGDGADPKLSSLINGRVKSKFLGFGFLLRQYLRKEELPSMLASARQEFSEAAGQLPRLEGARLMEAVENAATLRRVDALILLHRVLKIWVAPHVIFTTLMLVLMLIHIAQAVYFNVR
jgi:Fe-S-cluster-containing dehydrogenase component